MSAPSAQERAVAVVMVLASFTFQFEAYMLNVASPTIGHELNVSTGDLSLIVSLYLVATAAALVPAGKCASRFGLKPVFIAGCSVAALGSLIGGLADGVAQLWICRLVQGLGTGFMVTTIYGMVPRFMARNHAGWGYSMLSLGAGTGMILGLSAGGILASYVGWRSVVMTPMLLFVVLITMALRKLPREETASVPGLRFDIVAPVLFAACLISAVFFITYVPVLGWAERRMLSCLAAAALAALLLAVWIRWTGSTFFPKNLLRNRCYIASLLMMFWFQINIAGVMFVLPFELQGIVRLGAISCSLVLLAYPIAFSPTARWAGRQSDQVNPLSLITMSAGVGCVALALCAALVGSTAIWPILMLLTGIGIGSGLFTSPNNRLAMSEVADGLGNDAAAWLPVCLLSGSVVGVSVFQIALTGGGTFHPAALLTETTAEVQSFEAGLRVMFLFGATTFALLCATTLIRWRRAPG